MVYIVHGEDISKSRILIQNQQKKMGAQSRIEVEISEITPESLYEKGCSNDLFGNPPFIVLDVTNASRTNLEPYIEKITKIPESTTIIVLSGKPLTKTNAFVRNADKIKARLNLNEIKPQSNLFNFVDAVFYKQRERAYQELSKLSKDQVSPYEILSMMFYGIRTVTQAKTDSPSYKKLHPFVKTKAQNQSKNFTLGQLVSIYENFRRIDMKSKLSEIDEDMLIPMVIETVLNS